MMVCGSVLCVLEGVPERESVAKHVIFISNPYRKMALGLVVRRRRLTTSMWSMGAGYLGCLGHGDWAARASLEEVVAMPISRVSSGWAHSAAITASGDVMLWGRT